MENRQVLDRPFLELSASFRKIIVVRDSMTPKRDENGITCGELIQLLTDQNGLRSYLNVLNILAVAGKR